MPLNPSFDVLLEDYVFRVANAVIDQIDSDTQTHLIKFIYELNPGLTPLTNVEQSELRLSEPDAVYPPVMIATITNGPQQKTTLGSLRKSQQEHIELLTDLAQQLAQVKAYLESTQTKLQERIHLNKALMFRLEKYVLAEK